MPVLQLIFLLRSGVVIHSKHFTHDTPNEELVSPFISAIISFAQHSFKNSNLYNILIGNNLLTVVPIDIPIEILGIMLSTGIDDTTAYAILSEIMENFAIKLEQKVESGEIGLKDFKNGKMIDFDDLDDKIAEIITWEHQKEFINFDLSVSVPKRIIDAIQDLFKKRDDIGEIYQHKESSLIEQMLMEFLYYDLDEKIKQKFDLK